MVENVVRIPDALFSICLLCLVVAALLLVLGGLDLLLLPLLVVIEVIREALCWLSRTSIGLAITIVWVFYNTPIRLIKASPTIISRFVKTSPTIFKTTPFVIGFLFDAVLLLLKKLLFILIFVMSLLLWILWKCKLLVFVMLAFRYISAVSGNDDDDFDFMPSDGEDEFDVYYVSWGAFHPNPGQQGVLDWCCWLARSMHANCEFFLPILSSAPWVLEYFVADKLPQLGDSGDSKIYFFGRRIADLFKIGQSYVVE